MKFYELSSFCRLTLVAAAFLLLAPKATPDPSSDPAQTNRWPKLKEVLQKWGNAPLESVQKAAEAGDPTAQHYLGYCYTEGVRVPQDSNAGVAWYQRAYDSGYLPSASNLGFLYVRGKGVPKDLEKAVHFFRSAADKGFAGAQFNLGCLYRDGIGVAKAPAEAVKWFRLAAAQGDTMAMVEIGRACLSGQGAPQDSQQGLEWFKRAADLGEALGWLNLGMLYEKQQATDKALSCYMHAAEAGQADAMYKLFRIYYYGQGVPIDFDRGEDWLDRAADAGSTIARKVIGFMYETPERFGEGDERPANILKAIQWYRRFAGEGRREGYYHLGMYYLQGKGVELDEERGLDLIRKAADQGLAPAKMELAKLYSRGVGEPRNPSDFPVRLLQDIASGKAELEGVGSGEYLVIKEARESLVLRYQFGLGTERDVVAAAEWYCRAALAGTDGFSLKGKVDAPLSIRPVSMRFRNLPGRRAVGVAAPQVENEQLLRVLSLYLQAATHQEPGTRLKIAWMYAEGRDVPKDLVKAWLWFSVAPKQTAVDAQVANIESQMTSQEMTKAKSLRPILVEELSRVVSAMNESGPPPN